MAWRGEAGVVRRGLARPGEAWHGMAGVDWPGEARRGEARQAWLGARGQPRIAVGSHQPGPSTAPFFLLFLNHNDDVFLSQWHS